MSFFKIIFCLLLLSTLTSPVKGGELVTLAVENSWPPYADKHGNGISKKIIIEAFKAVNMEVEFIVVPYARALKMAELGKVHGAFNVSKQKDTMQRFNFGEEALLQAPAYFYFPNNSPLNFSSINQAPDGLTIGLIIGYEYGNNFEKNRSRFTEVRVSDQKQIISLLIKKRIDVAIMFDQVANEKLTEMSLPQSAIIKGHLNHISDIYIAFSKKRKTAPIIKKLDEGLRKIKIKNLKPH